MPTCHPVLPLESRTTGHTDVLVSILGAGSRDEDNLSTTNTR